jgi:CRP-like cAMP-binding protein
VRVCKNFAQPGEVELVTLGPKSFFGEMCILEAMPRSATVQAVAASRLFSLPAGAFHHLYKAMPAQYCILLLNIARDLSRRLRRLDEMFAARH